MSISPDDPHLWGEKAVTLDFFYAAVGVQLGNKCCFCILRPFSFFKMLIFPQKYSIILNDDKNIKKTNIRSKRS